MTTQRCTQPGCGGTIDGGFCDRCGMEPAPIASAPVPTITFAGPSGSARSAMSGTLSGRTGSSRRGTGSARASTRKHLGLGLVNLPDLPTIDPEKIILADPAVPDHKRFCANPDCHDANGNPTPLTRRQAGHCPQCGRRYSFVPTLAAGDVAGEQYEVKGCLAYGGLGWIYLARDRTLNRWVVLKGLLNTADESAALAAVAERQFLAAVKHPNLVGIYNFVTRGPEGYIVMEFVNGTTLKDLRKQRGPLPPAEAIAYMHRALGAFAYLHAHGMVFCDFKPDNCMLEGDPADIKVIDLGGVRRLDDPGGDVYGTEGYSAPEGGDSPSVASDLYTIGRTLAVLLMDFRFQSTHRHTLPTPSEQPVLARHEPLYRFLLRATAHDPDRRFQSADEMAEQLAGVLRQVVSETETPPPTDSSVFGRDVLALTDADGLAGPTVDLVPELLPDPNDPAAAFLRSTVLPARPSRRGTLVLEGFARFPNSAELALRHAACLADTPDVADQHLSAAETRDPFDWRVSWIRGRLRMQHGRHRDAMLEFERVFAELPGELAPQLAMAIAAEAAGDDAAALPRYDRVCRTDPGYVTAALGLARCQVRAGRRDMAADAYRRVPAGSNWHARGQAALARTLLANGAGLAELTAAAEVIAVIELDADEQARLRAEVFEAALRFSGASASAGVLGVPMRERALRLALEAELRKLARLEGDRGRQIGLIDRANAVRPWTWV